MSFARTGHGGFFGVQNTEFLNECFRKELQTQMKWKDQSPRTPVSAVRNPRLSYLRSSSGEPETMPIGYGSDQAVLVPSKYGRKKLIETMFYDTQGVDYISKDDERSELNTQQSQRSQRSELASQRSQRSELASQRSQRSELSRKSQRSELSSQKSQRSELSRKSQRISVKSHRSNHSAHQKV